MFPTGSASSSGEGGNNPQLQGQGIQGRPAPSRSYSQTSNIYTQSPPLNVTELGRTQRSYFPPPQEVRGWPTGANWPTASPAVESSSYSPRLSSPSLQMAAGSMGAASQRYSQDYYGSSVASNPYTASPPPGLTPSDLHSASHGLVPSQLTPHLLTPEGGAILASSQHRRSSGRDEFDGPHQLLAKPADSHLEIQESELIQLPISLYADEQDSILGSVNDRLAQCAYDFVAKYQFPIPLEPDKRPVRVPADREWTEWCYLLKRLATKRRIPARVLYNGQIKQLVTVLENSLEMRHAAKHQSRPLKDDRNVLQLISAGLQVAKMLKDPNAMRFLDELYSATEMRIFSRKQQMAAS